MALWLVTGGCGFIGSHLVAALQGRGDEVRVLDDLSNGKRENIRPDTELLVGDVADPKAVAKALDGVAGCFHLAAVASVQRCTEEWATSHRTNLSGTVTIFEEARRANPAAPIPVVYASSAAVYGACGSLPLREADATVPLSAYGVDKLGCELQGRIAWSVHHVPNVGLRFFNVYGPRQDPSSPYSGVIAIFSDRLIHDREVPVFGDGLQTRDFIYVDDVVAHLLAAMSDLRAGARIFNVCTGKAVSLLDLVEIMGSLLHRRPRLSHCAARPADIRDSIGDPTAADTTFGIHKRTAISEGLGRTIEAFRHTAKDLY